MHTPPGLSGDGSNMTHLMSITAYVTLVDRAMRDYLASYGQWCVSRRDWTEQLKQDVIQEVACTLLERIENGIAAFSEWGAASPGAVLEMYFDPNYIGTRLVDIVEDWIVQTTFGVLKRALYTRVTGEDGKRRCIRRDSEEKAVGPEVTSSLPSQRHGGEAEVIRADEAAAIWRSIAALEDPDLLQICRGVSQGLSFAQIAEALGTSKYSVGRRWRKALPDLQTILAWTQQ